MRTKMITGMMAASACVVLVGCGGSQDEADPDEFLVELDRAVAEYATELDAIDDDYATRDWAVPANPEAMAAWSRDVGVAALDDYLVRWDGYITALNDLALPEGFDGAEAHYAEGFPEYFRDSLIASERNALDATRAYREAWAGISDPLALQLRTTVPENELSRYLEADSEMRSALDALDEAWSGLKESLEVVDGPVDPIVGTREDSRMDQLMWRLSRLVEEIALLG